MVRAIVFLVMEVLFVLSWISNNIQASSTEPKVGYITAGIFLLATALFLYLLLPVVSRRTE